MATVMRSLLTGGPEVMVFRPLVRVVRIDHPGHVRCDACGHAFPPYYIARAVEVCRVRGHWVALRIVACCEECLLASFAWRRRRVEHLVGGFSRRMEHAIEGGGVALVTPELRGRYMPMPKPGVGNREDRPPQ